MKLLKRIAKFIVFFVFFLAVIFFGIAFVAGAIIGAKVGPRYTEPEARKAAVLTEVESFVDEYVEIMFLSSVLLSVVFSARRSFSGEDQK